MKAYKYTTLGYIVFIVILLMLFYRYTSGSFAQQLHHIELIIDIINVILLTMISKSLWLEHKNFAAISVWGLLLLLIDTKQLVIYNINLPHSVLFYMFVRYSWYAITILGLLSLLVKFIYQKREIYLLLTSFLFVTLVIIFFFSPDFIKYLSYPSYSIKLTPHIIIIYLCILLIVSIQDKYILLCLSGICLAEIGDFTITECYLQNNHIGLIYGQFCWAMGKLILSFGLLNIAKYKLYNPSNWFLNSSSVRNKFSFMIFHIAIWSFIIACIILKGISTITDSILLFIPSLSMGYALLAAIFSVSMGKQIEKPFIIMKNNIASVLEDKQLIIHSDSSLLEFQELQAFFVESYEYKTYLQKQLISLATRVAHDIKSPILIMENLISNAQPQTTETIKGQLIKQISKISYISRSMLKENKDFAGRLYGIQSIFTIAHDLVQDKQTEWAEESNVLNFSYNLKHIIWLTNEQAKIKTVLSNILNNAYEASLGATKKINFSIQLDQSNSNINIQIEDFGHGIPSSEITNILNGKSLKLNGNGIGLSSAKRLLESINGQLDISSKLNYGTVINLSFPLAKFTETYPAKLNISTNNIVILDDNITIINKWQNVFLTSQKSYQVQYFLNFNALKDYLLSLNDVNNDTTYLLDYNVFGERLTAIDIINQFKLINVYLVTNYAEDIKLQEEIAMLPIKLIPKVMLENNQDILTFH